MKPRGKGRPQSKRVEDLRAQLAGAEAALEEAILQAAQGTAQTAAAIIAAEQRDRAMLATASVTTDALSLLDAEIDVIEYQLAGLRSRRSAVDLENRLVTTEIAANAAEMVVLHKRMDRERAAFAPMEETRRREVERLQRRIGTIEAYHPDRRLTGLFYGPAGGAT